MQPFMLPCLLSARPGFDEAVSACLRSTGFCNLSSASMSTVAFTIGSFGDILAIVQLAYTIQKSIRGGGTSSAECRNLVQFLDTFGRTLQWLMESLGLLPSSNTTSTSPPVELEPSATIAIIEAVSTSKRLMTDFEKKLTPYTQSLVTRGSGNWVRDIWYRVNWSTIRAEAVDLRMSLTEQRNIIETVLTVSIVCA